VKPFAKTGRRNLPSSCASPPSAAQSCLRCCSLAVVGFANDTNRLANGYRVPVDPQFIPELS